MKRSAKNVKKKEKKKAYNSCIKFYNTFESFQMHETNLLLLAPLILYPRLFHTSSVLNPNRLRFIIIIGLNYRIFRSFSLKRFRQKSALTFLYTCVFFIFYINFYTSRKLTTTYILSPVVFVVVDTYIVARLNVAVSSARKFL